LENFFLLFLLLFLLLSYSYNHFILDVLIIQFFNVNVLTLIAIASHSRRLFWYCIPCPFECQHFPNGTRSLQWFWWT
jgi:hypothetical protein